jgi:hypothetical protein
VAPAARFGRDVPDPDPLAAEDAEDDLERSERDRVGDDFRLAPVDGALVVLARGRVRSLADLAASRAGTGAVLVGAPALVGAAPLVGVAPLACAGSTVLAAVAVTVAVGFAVDVAALGAGSVPFDRTADPVTSVRGSGVPFELSIAPMVSVGSVKGKRTSAG